MFLRYLILVLQFIVHDFTCPYFIGILASLPRKVKERFFKTPRLGLKSDTVEYHAYLDVTHQQIRFLLSENWNRKHFMVYGVQLEVQVYTFYSTGRPFSDFLTASPVSYLAYFNNITLLLTHQHNVFLDLTVSWNPAKTWNCSKSRGHTCVFWEIGFRLQWYNIIRQSCYTQCRVVLYTASLAITTGNTVYIYSVQWGRGGGGLRVTTNDSLGHFNLCFEFI